MADPQSSPPPAALPPPRGSRLNTLLLFLLVLFTGVLAADRVNEAVVRWRYERFLKVSRAAEAFQDVGDGGTKDGPDRDAAVAEYRETHKHFMDAFRARGLRHPDEKSR